MCAIFQAILEQKGDGYLVAVTWILSFQDYYNYQIVVIRQWRRSLGDSYHKVISITQLPVLSLNLLGRSCNTSKSNLGRHCGPPGSSGCRLYVRLPERPFL
jgi:hypothetical protein